VIECSTDGTVTLEGGEECTGTPLGGVPEATAELVTSPAATSAAVVTYVAVHVVLAPGASEVVGQVTGDKLVSLLSVIVMPVSSTALALVTRKL
jgi:hypothetical protein